MNFTTYDQDHGQFNCASDRGGGWWYNGCYWACLTCDAAHFEWYTLGYAYAANSRMMVKLQ